MITEYNLYQNYVLCKFKKCLTFFLFNKIGGTLCAQDVDNLKKWTPQAVLTLSMNLAPQGYKDSYNVARRFKSRFPALLNQSYSPEKFEVSALKIVQLKVNMTLIYEIAE